MKNDLTISDSLNAQTSKRHETEQAQSGLKLVFRLSLETLLVFMIPYQIYNMNTRLEISSLLFNIDLISAFYSYSIIPDSQLVLPSLLLCIPCLVWRGLHHKVSMRTGLLSVGLVILGQVSVLIFFLPIWAVFPWLFPGPIAAVIPDFIELISISGLVFTVFVYSQVVFSIVRPKDGEIDRPHINKIAYIMAGLFVLAPITMRIWNWQSSDWPRHFLSQQYFIAPIWSATSRVSGNLWGQNTVFFFQVFPTQQIIILGLIGIPAILFVRYLVRYLLNRESLTTTLGLGIVHIIILTIFCVQATVTESHVGSWIYIPIPILVIVGMSLLLVDVILSHRLVQKPPTEIQL